VRPLTRNYSIDSGLIPIYSWPTFQTKSSNLNASVADPVRTI